MLFSSKETDCLSITCAHVLDFKAAISLVESSGIQLGKIDLAGINLEMTKPNAIVYIVKMIQTSHPSKPLIRRLIRARKPVFM